MDTVRYQTRSWIGQHPSGIAAVAKQREELKKLLIEEFVKLCKHFEKPLANLAKMATQKG
jgi:hypothetical protein